MSQRLRDHPMTPIETAVHWTEHVAKFKGADHLKSYATQLSLIQLYNVDVWAFILGALAFIVFLIFKIFKAIISLVLPASSQPKKNKRAKRD